MRYIALFFLSISITSTICSQSRETENNRLQIETKSPKLRSATGWTKDALGSWISNINAISDIHLDEKTQSTVAQNFKWLQFVEFNFDNKPYYALLYESEAHISEARKEKRVYYYLISSSSYQSLVSNISNKSAETLTIHSNLSGYMSDNDGIYTQNKLINLISKSLQVNNNTQSDFKINAQHVDRADVVRFRLPEQASGLNKDLANSYFEVSWDSFTPLLLPLKTVAATDEFELEYDASNSTSNNLKNSDNSFDDRETFSSHKELVDTLSIYTDSIAGLGVNNSTEIISDRVSSEEPIVSGSIAILNGITGWYKNSEGKWVSDNDYSYNFETVGQYEFRNLTYRGKEYLILIRHEKYAGMSYYLILKEDYNREIEKINTASVLNFPILASCGIGNTLNDLIEKGKEVINSPEKEKIIIRDNYLTLQQKTSRSKNLARFFIFEKNCTQYGESGSVTCNANVSNKIRYDEVQYIGTEEIFSKMYYETDYSKFINFLKTPSQTHTLQNATKINKDLDFD